jgi:DNA polymerase-3 subunit gamma/tau
MSYLAIARKWRPMVFDEIVGQKHVTRTLQNAIKMERIHHAFLFTGPRGVGKTTAARILARALCCEQGPTPEPCGRCTLCTAILSGSAPDVIEIDGASNNSVDDVRELREGVRYLPSQGRYRIYIIDEVHMLTRQAFNALLKTLEEPPPHVIFMFATTEPQKIPETILSRVQRFDFKRIPGGQVAGRLASICEAEGVTVSEHALRLVARAGEGSMRDAQSLLDQVISFAGLEIDDQQVTDLLGLVDRGLLYEMLEGLTQGEPGRCLDAIARVHDYGYEMDQFTEELLELIRNAALVAMAPQDRRHLDLSDDEYERLKGLAEGLSPEVFARWFDALIEVHDRVARAARPRMVLEMAVARLATVRPVQGLDRVMARLEDLDRRLRQAGYRATGGKRGGPPFPPREAEAPRAPPAKAFHDTPSHAAPRPAPQPTMPGPRSAPAPAAEPEPPPLDPDDPGPGFDPADPAPRLEPPAREPPEPAAPEPPAPETLAARPPAPEPPVPEPPVARPEAPAPPPASSEPAKPAFAEPDIHPDDDTRTRYQAILAVLERAGPAWTSVVEHSVALSWSGQELKVAFASEFQLGQGRPLITGAEIRPLLARAFPGLGRVEVVLREQPQGRPPTRHEARKTARAEYLEALRREVDRDPLINRLRDQLQLELVDYIPTDPMELNHE